MIKQFLLAPERKETLQKTSKRGISVLWSIYRFVTMFCIGMILMLPLLYMVSVGFRDASDMTDPMVVWIPANLTWDNLVYTFQEMDYPVAFFNSVRISLIASLLSVLSCALAGYGFSRFHFFGKNFFFGLVILMLIVLPQNYLISLFVQYREFDFFGIGSLIGLFGGSPLTVNLSGTELALYLPAALGAGLRSGLYILIFTKFFTNIPAELEDAAGIDGCGHYRAFFAVILPNARTAILTVFLFSIVWYWNDYFFTSTFMQDTITVSVQLTKLHAIMQQALNPVHTSTTALDPNELTVHLQAGCLLAITPPTVMYLFLQKKFTEGLERTGIVG
ncbi:MAG: carbohydrate ABC transporter permease [Ruminococcaceae bacterium]|nr:carbohydrate ABC transporter permease [Oscillospiraceae bacterium]